MNSLTEKEKAHAFEALFGASIVGLAIVNKDFTFRHTNEQFCAILGVTPAELIGLRFQDITSAKSQRVDEENSKLIMDGKISSYMMEKTYSFENGRSLEAVLVVARVPMNTAEPFAFFLSQVVTNEEKSKLVSTPQTLIGSLLEFIKKYGQMFVTAGAFVGGVILTLLKGSQ